MVWNRPFKANVAEQYDEWMAGEAHSLTAAANMHHYTDDNNNINDNNNNSNNNNNNNNNNDFITV